jgi:hypothetical protein
MRWTIALAALMPAAPALGCPPPPPRPPGYVYPTLEEVLRQRADATPNIVYAVVERPILAPDPAEGPGTVRIVHVYKGGLRVGQRIAMVFERPRTDCDWGPNEGASPGTYGVMFLPRIEGSAPIRYMGFQHPGTVQQMIGFGIISSARPAPEAARP